MSLTHLGRLVARLPARLGWADGGQCVPPYRVSIPVFGHITFLPDSPAGERTRYGAVAMSWFGRKRATPSIESLRFGTNGWKFHGEKEPGRMRVWETADHDAISLHFFGIPPNLPAAKTVDEISAMYASGLASAGGKVVECSIFELARCDAVRLLLKVPQKPSGMMYQGAVTVPFRDFSFVIKIQCPEQGMSGVREALLLDKRLSAGEKPNFERPGELFPGWDPDAPEHDSTFPTHPVSRLRRILKGIEDSAVLDEQIRRLPSFRLPGRAT
jgi:hypothetical protein